MIHFNHIKKTWTQEQIISLLREAESGQTTIAQLCRLRGVSQNSFYKWRTQYGSMTINEAPPGGTRQLSQQVPRGQLAEARNALQRFSSRVYAASSKIFL